MPIGRHALGSVFSDFQGSPEEPLGRIQIAMFTESGINKIAMAIDGAVQVLPHPTDFDVGLVDMPGAASLPFALATQLVGHQRGEARFPLSHRFVCERKAALKKHLRKVPQAELVAQPPEHNQQHDIGGELELVVGGAGPLVELSLARGTGCPLGEGAIAQLGALRQLDRCRGGAVRAGHPVLPGKLNLAATRIPEKLWDMLKLSPDATTRGCWGEHIILNLRYPYPEHIVTRLAEQVVPRIHP